MIGPLINSVAGNIPFDNTGTGLTATDLQTAVEQLNTRIILNTNFSYFYIALGTTIVIPQYQEMLTTEIMVDGSLEIDGRLTLLDI